MRARLKDQFAQGRRRRPDQARVGADALDCPAGIAPMAGRHVLGNGRVLVVTAGAHMRGDPLAFEENLDGPHRQPRVDLGAGAAMGHAVIMGGDLDVIVDADAASPPFRELVRLGRQGPQRWPIDRLQQLTARRAEPADRTLFVEMRHEVGDRRVDVRQAVKGSVTQPPEQPSLDDEHGLLNLGFVSGPPRPRRQNGGSVMRRHFGIGPIDLRIVKAGLDDGGLGIVRHEQLRDAVDRRERTHVGVDPVRKRLRPACVREGEARGAEPSTATKICAMRISPVSRSTTTGTPSPA